jgi:G3E family GTPase
MLPVTVITGFLGSGKTTLINHLVRDPAMANTAVLVNEFGEIGLDHLLVEHVDAATILVGAGCLCCEVRGELVVGIKALQQRVLAGELPAFNHLLIETTGLADPAPVLHTLLSDDSLKQSCRVAGVVTVVDALHGQEHLSRHSEALHQITAADRLVLTKTDLASAQDLQTLQKRLADLNPGARLLAGTIDGADLLAAESALPDRWLHAVSTDHSHDPSIGSVSLETPVPLETHRVIAWIEQLMAQCGDQLLRFKGVMNLAGADAPVAVHGVQHVFHPLERLAGWGNDNRTTRLVLIGHDLPESILRESFAALVERCRH